MSTDLTTLQQQVFDYVYLRLGGDMVDVELDPAHYEMSLSRAFDVYRQKASNSVEESYAFLQIVKDQNEYILDSNIVDVKSVLRRTIGSTQGNSANQFEPFEAGYLNHYMLKSGRVGGLATYDLYAGYQELSARMFGGFMQFHWNKVNKKLTLVRHTEASGEVMMLHVYNYKPNEILLQDTQIKPWLYDYTLAMCKYSLGEARSKFATIAGPQGGTTLNGDSLKAEAQAEMEKLEQDLGNFVDGSNPMSFIIG